MDVTKKRLRRRSMRFCIPDVNDDNQNAPEIPEHCRINVGDLSISTGNSLGTAWIESNTPPPSTVTLRKKRRASIYVPSTKSDLHHIHTVLDSPDPHCDSSSINLTPEVSHCTSASSSTESLLDSFNKQCNFDPHDSQSSTSLKLCDLSLLHESSSCELFSQTDLSFPIDDTFSENDDGVSSRNLSINRMPLAELTNDIKLSSTPNTPIVVDCSLNGEGNTSTHCMSRIASLSASPTKNNTVQLLKNIDSQVAITIGVTEILEGLSRDLCLTSPTNSPVNHRLRQQTQCSTSPVCSSTSESSDLYNTALESPIIPYVRKDSDETMSSTTDVFPESPFVNDNSRFSQSTTEVNGNIENTISHSSIFTTQSTKKDHPRLNDNELFVVNTGQYEKMSSTCDNISHPSSVRTESIESQDTSCTKVPYVTAYNNHTTFVSHRPSHYTVAPVFGVVTFDDRSRNDSDESSNSRTGDKADENVSTMRIDTTVEASSVVDPTVEAPTVVDFTVEAPTVVDRTVVDPTVEAHTVVDFTVVDHSVVAPTVEAPTVVAPTVVDRSVVDPTVEVFIGKNRGLEGSPECDTDPTWNRGNINDSTDGNVASTSSSQRRLGSRKRKTIDRYCTQRIDDEYSCHKFKAPKIVANTSHEIVSLYTDKNYQAPKVKAFETINEGNCKSSKKRLRRFINFDDTTRLSKIKTQRSKKASKLGWSCKERRDMAITDEVFQDRMEAFERFLEFDVNRESSANVSVTINESVSEVNMYESFGFSPKITFDESTDSNTSMVDL